MHINFTFVRTHLEYQIIINYLVILMQNIPFTCKHDRFEFKIIR